MVPSDPDLPRAAERTLRFLDEVDVHRLTVTSAPLTNVGQSAAEFAARFAAPEPERPMLKFLDPDDVRQTMSYFARTRVHTEIVERIVEVPVERRIYVPMRTFGPRDSAPSGAPAFAPSPESRTTGENRATGAPATERAPRQEMPSVRGGEPARAANVPFAGMDRAVQNTFRKTMLANVGGASYLAGLSAASPASSPGFLAALGRLAQASAQNGGSSQAFLPGSPIFGVPGFGGSSGFPGLPGTSSALWSPGPQGPLAMLPRLFGQPAGDPGQGPATLSAFGGFGPVARLTPVVEEAVRRANGGPALLFRLPGAASQVAAERGVGPEDLDVLDRATQTAIARASGPQAASLGQVTLVAPDLRLASKDAAAAGTAVALPWQALAAGAGPLDESGLANLRPLLPAGAHLIYPALPVGTPGATNLPLAQGLVARMMGSYGPAGAMAAQAVAAQAAQAGAAATSAPSGSGRVQGSIVPTGRPSAVGTGGLFGGKGDPLAEAGAGQAKRGGALDFLGVPVQLAPSLAADPGLRRERSLAKAATGSSGGAPASPEAFGLLRQRLFPKVGSVVAEPDMPAWRRRAQESGLRDANPAALLAPDARAPRPDAAAKPQLESGPLAHAARPFAPALALAEQVAGRGNAGAALSSPPPPHAAPRLGTAPGSPAGHPLSGRAATGSALPFPSWNDHRQSLATGPLAQGAATPRPSLGNRSMGHPAFGDPPTTFGSDGTIHPAAGAPWGRGPAFSPLAATPRFGSLPGHAEGEGSRPLGAASPYTPGAMFGARGFPGLLGSSMPLMGAHPATDSPASSGSVSSSPSRGLGPFAFRSPSLRQGSQALAPSLATTGFAPRLARHSPLRQGPQALAPSLLPSDPYSLGSGSGSLPAFATPSLPDMGTARLPYWGSLGSPAPGQYARPSLGTHAATSAPFLPRPGALPFGLSSEAPSPGSFPFVPPLPSGRSRAGGLLGSPLFGAPGPARSIAFPAARTFPAAPRSKWTFPVGPASARGSRTEGHPFSGIALRPPRAPGFGRSLGLPGAPVPSLGRPLRIGSSRIDSSAPGPTFPGMGSRSVAPAIPPLSASARGAAPPAALRVGTMRRPSLGRAPWIGPRAPETSLDVPAAPSVELPPAPRVSLPRPSAGPLRPSAPEPPTVTLSSQPDGPSISLAMPVLKRPAPTPTKSAPPVAIGPVHVQRALPGSSSSATSSNGAHGEPQDAERPDGARVQVLAREVYGILRRRLRDEMERAKPYNRF